MSGQNFIQHNGSGGFNESTAPQVGGVGAENKIPALDVNGRLDETMLPTGVGADTAGVTASETLAAGDFVNIYNDAGSAKVRKADATNSGKPAHGFVKSAVANGGAANVYFDGNNDAVTGATAGPVYLSTTAGGVAFTAPSASGNLVQKLGVATSATSINFTQTAGVALA